MCSRWHVSTRRANQLQELARNYAVLADLRKAVDEESLNWGKLSNALVEASHTFAFDADDEAEYERTATAALSVLDECKADLTSELTGYEITAVGHAHIDLAWLWPWSETVRKGARSFLNLISRTTKCASNYATTER